MRYGFAIKKIASGGCLKERDNIVSDNAGNNDKNKDTILSMTEVNELDTSINVDDDATVVIAQEDPDKTVIADNLDATVTLGLDEATVIAGATNLLDSSDKTATTKLLNPTPETNYDATVIAENDAPTQLAGGTEAIQAAIKPTFTPRMGVGSVINDRFSLEKLLGRGGMGEVYLATDKRKVEAQDKNPYVAMKVLGENFKQHPQAFIALQREARKTQELAHPNIVTVYDFDRQGDSVYLTMEALDGKPMDEEIRSDAREIPEAVDMITQCAQGLAYAHQKNLVHSDLKPGNVFICNDGKVKLLDFGIARAFKSGKDLDDQDPNNDTVFDAGDLGALTPAYASLEMIEGEEPHLADDVYAMGLIAYELLTGKHPFNKVMASKARDQGLKAERIAGLSKQQWQAIEQALAFERSDRIQDANDFLQNFTAKSKTPLYIAASVILAAFIGVGSISFFIEPELGPEIPFEQLSTSDQSAFNQQMQEAEMSLKFGDLNSAILHYDKAFSIHAYNPELMVAADKAAAQLLAKIQPLPTQQQKAILDSIKEYPVLTSNKAIQAALNTPR